MEQMDWNEIYMQKKCVHLDKPPTIYVYVLDGLFAVYELK